ncbi:hypothetical protein ACX93W_26145 [Paenibacillus sp. CAU 1782]
MTSNGQAQTTSYKYDATGNLIYVVDDAGQHYQYVYNRLGLVTAVYINGQLQKSQQYNEIGLPLVKTDAAGLQETFAYKNNGLLDKYKDADGQQYHYSYTPYNEQARLSVRNAAGAETYWNETTYDPSTRLITGVANSENEFLGYQYDTWKRLNQRSFGGTSYTIGYDAYDRLTSVTYPGDQKSATYGYDTLGRITSH